MFSVVPVLRHPARQHNDGLRLWSFQVVLIEVVGNRLHLRPEWEGWRPSPAIIQSTLRSTPPPQGREPSTWPGLEANAKSPCSRPEHNPPASARRSSSLVLDKQCSQVPSPCVFLSPGPYVPSRAEERRVGKE